MYTMMDSRVVSMYDINLRYHSSVYGVARHHMSFLLVRCCVFPGASGWRDWTVKRFSYHLGGETEK